ncbi:N-acetylmuramoyl-L-alanine amidase [Alisedimentitalea sp. MJ-SS2]|uniref:N-acetylmuramoyl-L-alanine amidase n=1 Tax=Aliisedimentitalea sp. MJ-SS2 TaxID=3049795 RepID=UPI00290CA91F|nr:N-acetylmuramoyl-L-alanine amidase [Alisedimentitalea sp. MJ-SS2]MDU8926449.1 N-acetylmuramoyl-L-alanine amidase [Alisedimentitalea sp. MJ-SS2]
MSGLIRIVSALALCLWATFVGAQGFSGLAKVDPTHSRIEDQRGGAVLRLGLSQGVPHRVFTLGEPDRLILDFAEVDWTGLDAEALAAAEGVVEVRFGGFRPGWSRMVIDLARPMVIDTVDLRVDDETGKAKFELFLARATADEFKAASSPPLMPDWAGPPTVTYVPREDDDRLRVLIDPGHGGIDPGAERNGEQEKNLMLLFAFDLRDALLRVDGIDVMLTREDDSFVSLERRVAIAHQAGADIFLSLHADTLSEGRAHGAAIYTLDKEASDEASALLAERHNRADMLAGVDLTGSDDVIADILFDLARLETRPRTLALAKAMVEGLDAAEVPLNRRPHRTAAFSVLKAADIPSVLLEIGFISSDRDLKNLTDPLWRRRAAEALRDAIQAWIISDQAARDLVRQ